MTITRVSKFTIVDSGATANLTEDALLQRIIDFITEENLLDLDGDYEQDVLLEQARSDEKRLGVLSPFERKAFVLTALLEQRLNDMMVETEASSAEQVTAIMRERKIGFIAASTIYTKDLKMDTAKRIEMNMCSMTHTNLVTLYDWSVRQRFNQWTMRMIVRNGFIVHGHE